MAKRRRRTTEEKIAALEEQIEQLRTEKEDSRAVSRGGQERAGEARADSPTVR